MAAKSTPSFAPPSGSERRTSRPSPFVSTCPVCGQERVQYAYTRRALVGLLETGQKVDARCGTCDVVWPVSAQERVTIARAVLAESTERRAVTGAYRLMDESMYFTSTCPKCSEGQPQRGYTRRTLANLLSAGYQIEAHCVGCNNFWQISAQERRFIVDALGELIYHPRK